MDLVRASRALTALALVLLCAAPVAAQEPSEGAPPSTQLGVPEGGGEEGEFGMGDEGVPEELRVRPTVVTRIVVVREQATPAAQLASEPAPQPQPVAVAPAEPVEAIPGRPGEGLPGWAERSSSDLYGSALGGAWLGAIIGMFAAGAAGMAIGAGLTCGTNCLAGMAWGSLIAGSFGWILGVGIGTAVGARINPGEAFLMWFLGVLAGGAVAGLSVLVGSATASTDWYGRNDGTYNGAIAGSILGPLAQVFLTPLFATAAFGDTAGRRVAGMTAGLGGSF